MTTSVALRDDKCWSLTRCSSIRCSSSFFVARSRNAWQQHHEQRRQFCYLWAEWQQHHEQRHQSLAKCQRKREERQRLSERTSSSIGPTVCSATVTSATVEFLHIPR